MVSVVVRCWGLSQCITKQYNNDKLAGCIYKKKDRGNMMFCQSLPIKQISTLIILLFFYISCTHLPPRVDEFGRPQRDYTYQPPIQTGDGWEISTLKREGIDPEYLNRLMSLILQETYEDFHSILIVKDGKLVLKNTFQVTTVIPCMLWLRQRKVLHLYWWALLLITR